MTERPDALQYPFLSRIDADHRRRSTIRGEQWQGALDSLRRDDPDAWIRAARSLKEAGRLCETLDLLRQGIERCAPSARLHEYYIERLEKCNRTEEAVDAARNAARLFPEHLIFRIREALLLPVFYDSRDQANRWRQRFTERLHRLVTEVPLNTPDEQEAALSAIAHSSNKYLPYQGENDCDLQKTWGAWVERIVQANYAHWTRSDPMPSLNGKTRVGFLTAFSHRFLNLSSGKLFGAWIRDLDRERFEVFAYHADNVADTTAEFIDRWKVPFRQHSGDVGQTAAAIRADRLHVLIYLDFGIHPRMAQLAALKLAPIQCVAWDTPLTSGMPAMDYFLSSDLMEPPDAPHHYSEELVRLPGVGVSFTKPVIPAVILSKTRGDFGLREDAVVYLCCQSVFKYSPEQDEVVIRIAQRVPASQFVFLMTNEIVGSDLRTRMERAFSAAGLNATEHCVWLPEMPVLDYWNLHRIADLSLDTLFWSGGVTAFEAIACGLPIVTTPGSLMRARHSAAILTQLGVPDTIARDAAEYVEIAVRLGLDRSQRIALVSRMAQNYPNLYSDAGGIAALQDFLQRTVNSRM